MYKAFIILFIICLLISCNTKQRNEQSKLPKYIQEINTSVQQNPDSAALRIKLAEALDSLHLFKQASEQIDSLIKKDSNNYDLWFRKARLKELQKDTVRAINAYTKAVNIYPMPDGMLSLANLLAETKNANALSLVEKVAELNLGKEYNAHCYFIIGVYYARTGQTKKALVVFDNCINEDFGYMEAYMEKGIIWYDQKKYNEALKVFSMASKINNTYADAYYWQGRCYENLKDTTTAIKNFQLSLALDNSIQESREAIKRLSP